ncbi:MAG: PucR family transcriptional regulator [Clostridiales bacterium]|nr:PucR family transcriptional regulator [Clostridiales bacterium]
MLTVSDVMTFPLFKNVQLVAGKSGINNIILNTGILDWETVDIIPQYFNDGEIVLTALTNAKESRFVAEHYIKTLIINNASAIMIKTVYFFEISDELKQFAQEKKVPIFFFSDVYMDDIIYEIKKQLEIEKDSFKHDLILDRLFNMPDTPCTESGKLLKQMNPYFFEQAFITLYISDNEIEKSDKMHGLHEYIYHTQNLLEYIKNGNFSIVYSQLFYKRGIMLIISFDMDEFEEVKTYSNYLLEKLRNDKNFEGTKIGIGSCNSPNTIQTAIRSAIFANVKCIINNLDSAFYDSRDSIYSLLSVANQPKMQEYRKTFEGLLSHPAKKYTPLLDTALCFVIHGGDVEDVANELFQHKNTIRYRLKGITEIFEAENQIELYGRLYIFFVLHKSSPFLSMFYLGNNATPQ